MTAIDVIRGIVSLTYLLVISPYLLGSLLCYKMEGEFSDSYVFRYVVGFFSQVGIWGFIALPFRIFLNDMLPFRYLCYFFMAILIVITGWRIVLAVRDKKYVLINTDTHVCFNMKSKILMLFFVCISAYLLFCMIYSAPANDEYGDVPRYISEILDSLEMGSIMSGGAKRILAPWLYYYTMLATVSHQHPLFICETIVPLVIYALGNIVMYIAGSCFFKHDRDKTIVFMTGVLIFICIFYESVSSDYIYFIYPAMYGKTILFVTAIPLMYVLFCLATENQRLLLLLLVGGGVAWLSMTSIMCIPIGVGSIAIYNAVKQKWLQPLKWGLVANVGCIVQIAGYIVLLIQGKA